MVSEIRWGRRNIGARPFVLATIGLSAIFAMLGETVAFDNQWGLEVEWTFNTSAQFWNQTFGAGHQGCLTVWDVDDDGKNELLFGTRQFVGGPQHPRRLWCIEQDGTFQWVYPPLDAEGLPGDPTSKVSLIDVDNDGTYELCFAGRGGRLHVLNGDGSVKWTWDNPNTGTAMHGSPQAFDVDDDGLVEFFLNDYSGFVHRVNHLGNLVWSIESGGRNEGQPTIADIDRDGRYEVLWASQDHYLYCAAAYDGSVRWRFNTEANMQTNPVIVADVNGDGEYEAMVWTDVPSSAVFVVKWDGTMLGRWRHPRDANIRLDQAVGDVDGDGNLEMALMSSSGVFLLEVLGTELLVEWETNFTEWSELGMLPAGAVCHQYGPYQLIADADGDDELEILWLAPFPIVTDAVTGSLEAYYCSEHLRLGHRAEDGGWWGDVDRDGESEWVVVLQGNSHAETMVYCLTMGGKFPAESPWPEYHHSAYPAGYQDEQDWLTLKSAYSNSLWFPIQETFLEVIPSTLAAVFLRLGTVVMRRNDKRDRGHARNSREEA